MPERHLRVLLILYAPCLVSHQPPFFLLNTLLIYSLLYITIATLVFRYSSFLTWIASYKSLASDLISTLLPGWGFKNTNMTTLVFSANALCTSSFLKELTNFFTWHTELLDLVPVCLSSLLPWLLLHSHFRLAPCFSVFSIVLGMLFLSLLPAEFLLVFQNLSILIEAYVVTLL